MHLNLNQPRPHHVDVQRCFQTYVLRKLDNAPKHQYGTSHLQLRCVVSMSSYREQVQTFSWNATSNSRLQFGTTLIYRSHEQFQCNHSTMTQLSRHSTHRWLSVCSSFYLIINNKLKTKYTHVKNTNKVIQNVSLLCRVSTRGQH